MKLTLASRLVICMIFKHNHAHASLAYPAFDANTTLQSEQGPDGLQTFNSSQSRCELDVLDTLGWQHAYNPAGYAISTELPANCTAEIWQSLGCLASLTDLALTGNLLALPDSWATIDAFPSLSILTLSSTTLTGKGSSVVSIRKQS